MKRAVVSTLSVLVCVSSFASDHLIGMMTPEPPLEEIRQQVTFLNTLWTYQQGAITDQFRRECNARAVKVSWDDTCRKKNSSSGCNIADVKNVIMLPVNPHDPNGPKRAHALPIIRAGSNMKDPVSVTKVDRSGIKVRVPKGNCQLNSKGEVVTEEVPLSSYLANIKKYHPKLNLQGQVLPKKTASKNMIVSHQVALVPPTENLDVLTTPNIYTYSGSQKSPAALTIMIAPGSPVSLSVSDNKDMGGGSSGKGKRLFINKCGKRAAIQWSVDKNSSGTGGAFKNSSQSGLGANQTMVIQIPLEHKARVPKMSIGAYKTRSFSRRGAGLSAVVGKPGPAEGPYQNIDSQLKLKVNEKLPIRVTMYDNVGVQIPKGKISETTGLDKKSVKAICAQLKASYARSQKWANISEHKIHNTGNPLENKGVMDWLFGEK